MKNMILIGSRALTLRAPFLLNRKPLDFDFICTRDSFDEWLSKNAEGVGADPSNKEQVYSLGDDKMIVQGTKAPPIEFEIVKPGSSSEIFYDFVKNDKETKHSKFGMVPNLDLLFFLKASHRYKKDSPHFFKTCFDYHAMKKFGAKIRPEYMDAFKLREKETYTNKLPKLKGVKKDEFFDPNSGVDYKFDHDSIHVAVKHLEKPAYRYFMKDGEQVQCDKNKFFALDQMTRLYSVLEESYVLALERSQIPFEGRVAPKASFSIAISKVCSSITSGWWREFAYDNILDVLKMYNDDYIDRFRAGIESGIVKPFNPHSPENPYK